MTEAQLEEIRDRHSKRGDVAMLADRIDELQRVIVKLQNEIDKLKASNEKEDV